MTEPQLAAFHRLLSDAHQGGQAKVDALVALSQRTVYLVPWPAGIEGYRTLINSEGLAALPIFTAADQLEDAARRYGWLDATGDAPKTEIDARAALVYALDEKLTYVVVDIAADHALELTLQEFEPLLTPAARRDSTGPYAGTGKISSSLIRAVQSTPAPADAPGGPAHRAPPPGSLKAPRVPSDRDIGPPGARPGSTPPAAPEVGDEDGFTVSTDFNPSAQTFGGGTSVSVASLTVKVTDEVYEGLTVVLRGYPEVEWACLCSASRGPSAPVPTVGLRVDTGYRQRVNELISEVRHAGDAHGASLDVLLLDDPELTRHARAQGEVFYPWRKK